MPELSYEYGGVTAYPLSWPVGWSREGGHKRAPFGRAYGKPTTIYGASQRLRAELARVDAENVVLSTNLRLNRDGTPMGKQAAPRDVGAACYFDLWNAAKDGFVPSVLACDRWDRVEHNIHAIALHVEAMRAQERWGVGSLAQAFAGYQALPARASGTPWWETLGCARTADRDAVERAFRVIALKHHPDRGGAIEKWNAATEALRQGRAATA